jgi:hypothetical protein
MDFNAAFVLGIVALQLVDFRQGVVVIPFFLPYRKGDAPRWRPLPYFGRFVRPSVFLTLLHTFFVTLHVFFMTLHV